MASRPGSFMPAWPTPTPHSPKPRKRKWDAANQPSSRSPRQLPPIATVNSNDCGALPDNNQFTCFPTANSSVIQNIPTRLVWNKGVPIFSQTKLVDVYLYHGDTDELVAVWKNREYPQGHLAVTPNDTWWGEKGQEFIPGVNQTQTFFFIMVVNGTDPSTGISQSTFTATQTNFPNSILASQASASLTSLSSASLASLASLSSAVLTSTLVPSASSTPSGNGNLQDTSSDQPFPHWAIALLAVFGFLALVAFVAVFWLLIRHLRRRRRELAKAHRNSLGSDSPMMADIGGSTGHGNGAQSPITAESGLGPLPTIPVGVGMGSSAAVMGGRSNVQSDGASTISRADSAGGPFSQTDAAAMAAAFRNVMRKPDFANQPMEEGDSPGQVEGEGEEDEEDEEARRHEHEVLMGRELAEEGRDIRSVSSSRGVRVETLSDGGRTAD